MNIRFAAFDIALPHVKTLACVRAFALAATTMNAGAEERVALRASPPQATASAGAMVEFVVPALPTNKPQPPEVQEANRKHGRESPPPEVLQPTLDPALPAYQPRKEGKLVGALSGAASDVLPALVNLWFEGFRKYHPDVKLSIVPPYAGSLGAKELLHEKVDFVFVSRELKPDDISDFKAKYGHDPLSVPVSGGSYRHFGFLDAVGFFVHKDNPLEKISYEQLDAIFSSTRHRGGKPIATWGQLGLTGEWADKPIRLYGIKPWNGFEEFVRQRVLSVEGKRGEWRDNITMEKLVFPMAKYGAQDRYALGYTGMAFVDSPVRLLAIGENEKGPFYSPTYENVALATYPLSRLVFFNTNKAPGKPMNPIAEEFLRFVLSKQGQQIVLKHAIYLPLRAEQVKNARALLDN